LNMSRVLIVRACAIGDFVLNLPALQALARSLPDAEFTLVGYPSTLELAKEFMPVRAVHSIDTPPWSDLFIRPLSGLGFDSAIVWMKDDGFANNLRASGVPKVLLVRPFPAFGHAADHLLRTLKLPCPPLPDLWKRATDEIMLHPGSGSPKKCWPYFDQLGKMLATPVVLLGPNEVDFASPHPVLRNLPLTDVLNRLRNCRAYVGNDSGITHLAGYVGCPTVALFGPTDPGIWGPIGRRVRIIWKREIDRISPEEVKRLLNG
jgi:ADP-heptose:LPS heptosyltransferase